MTPETVSHSAPAADAKQDHDIPPTRGWAVDWLGRLAFFGSGALVGGLCGAAAMFHFISPFKIQRLELMPADGSGTPIAETTIADDGPLYASDGSLNIWNEDIRGVLKRLAKECGKNIVMSDHVLGTVNFVDNEERETSPREALEIIVQANGLIMDEGSDTLFVKTPAEKAKEPTESQSYTFQNAKVADAAKLLARQLQAGVEPLVDERTNTVFYRENRSNCERVREFLKKIDAPVEPR